MFEENMTNIISNYYVDDIKFVKAQLIKKLKQHVCQFHK